MLTHCRIEYQGYISWSWWRYFQNVNIFIPEFAWNDFNETAAILFRPHFIKKQNSSGEKGKLAFFWYQLVLFQSFRVNASYALFSDFLRAPYIHVWLKKLWFGRWLSIAFLCVSHLLLCFLQEAQAYAEENSLLFMETSAKTAMNVNDIFLAIGKL